MVFPVQCKYLVLLLLVFTLRPVFSASCLSLQKISIKICFVLPNIMMSSAMAQICFNLVVIFAHISKLVIMESSTTLNSKVDKGSPCLTPVFVSNHSE